MENIERDTLEVDVLFVGAGPASLAGALRLRQLINKHNEEHGNALGEITIAVIEKGREIGSHMISGAVMDIRPLAELLPNYSELGAPLEAEVGEEDVSYLTRRFKIKSPIIPPPLNNHGKYVVSLNKLVRWLGPIVEAADVMLDTRIPRGRAALRRERPGHRCTHWRQGNRQGRQAERKLPAGRRHLRQSHRARRRRARLADQKAGRETRSR